MKIKEISEKTDIPVQTLYDWRKTKPKLMKLIIDALDEDSKNEIREVNELKKDIEKINDTLNRFVEAYQLDKIQTIETFNKLDKNVKALEKMNNILFNKIEEKS